MSLKVYKIFLITLFNVLPITAQKGIVNITVDAKVQTLMGFKKEINQDQNPIMIQIYNGSRENAEESLEKFSADFPNLKAQMIYETPNYKIWIGEFRTQLEADRELAKIRKKFNQAFSFKPKQTTKGL